MTGLILFFVRQIHHTGDVKREGYVSIPHSCSHWETRINFDLEITDSLFDYQMPPACWSTFWKSNFKQQLGCRFDIMDNKSYFFVFWHMQLYMSWYIRSFFGFTFLNILYFLCFIFYYLFLYSCTNIFHRRSLYTFYWLSKLFYPNSEHPNHF